VPRETHQDGWVGLAGKKTKKWIGKWHPYRADGVRTTARIVLGEKAKMTKWQAEDALRQHIAKKTEQQIRCPEGDPTLQQFWERSYLPSRTWSVATKATVTNVIARHLLPQFGTTKLVDLEKLAIQRHVNALAESYSQSIVQKVLRQLRGMLEEALEQDLIAKNPARRVKMPNTRRPCGRFLMMEELDALLAQVDSRDSLIIWLFCKLGLRPGELFALRWNDIDGSRIRIDESATQYGMMAPKTLASDVYHHMPPRMAAQMEDWRAKQLDTSPLAFVFPTATGQPIEAHNFERDVLVPAAIRAGIMPKLAKDRKKGDPRRDKATAVNFQAFRRTYGTWMQRTGASVKDAQGAMRHASPDQTLRVYMREIPDGSRMAIDALELLYDAKCGLAAGTPRGAAN
jgi:integrase